MHVLVVDDDEGTRFIVKRALARRGDARASEARDGEEAVRFLRTHRADVVLSDYRMPGRNGVEVLCEARTVQPRARRVLMSGTLNEDILHLTDSAGCAHFVFEKPMGHREWDVILGAALGEEGPPHAETHGAGRRHG